MKALYQNIARLHTLTLEDDISYTKEQLEGILSLIRMSDTHAKVTLSEDNGIVHAEFDIKSHLVLECAYTLEEVDYPIHFKEELDFCFGENELSEEDENLIYVEGNTLDLDGYILGLIVTEIPMKVIKKGAILPSGGNGYEVISEEEYYKRLEEQDDPRFSSLDDFEFDE